MVYFWVKTADVMLKYVLLLILPGHHVQGRPRPRGPRPLLCRRERLRLRARRQPPRRQLTPRPRRLRPRLRQDHRRGVKAGGEGGWWVLEVGN